MTIRATQENDESAKLYRAFDRLVDANALDRSNWLATSAALRFFKELLCRLCSGSATDGLSSSRLRFPSRSDPLYIWFVHTQESFQGNIVYRLLEFMRRISSFGDLPDTDQRDQVAHWISSTLYLLQGSLFLHGPSKALFARRPHMQLLLQLINAKHPEGLQVRTIQTIIAALVDTPQNMRVFEDSGGLETVRSLFIDPNAAHHVKVKILEFLYFYLMPERTASQYSQLATGTTKDPVERTSTDSNASTLRIMRHVREPGMHQSDNLDSKESACHVRTTEEKQVLLGRYFSNIEALVADLREFKPFGDW